MNDPSLQRTVAQYESIAYGYPNFFFDFNRIIGELVDLLIEKPEHLERLRQRFRHLIVDEYQDVDSRQEELISILSNRGRDVDVTVVGDDDQAIYGWRGARVRNILEFEHRYVNVTRVTLAYNFRSTHTIVAIANNAVRKLTHRHAKSMEARWWDGERFAEQLGNKGEVQMRTFSSEAEEARWVASRIEELRGTYIQDGDSLRAIDYADMAILLRSVKSSGSVFAEGLRECGIPAVVKGIGGLFDSPEVCLVQASFCLLARSKLLRRVQGGKMKKYEERELRELVRELLADLHTHGSQCWAGASEFLEWISAKREELDRRNLESGHIQRGRLARRIYPQAVYHEMLGALGSTKSPWPSSVLYNLGQVSHLITQFEAVHQWVTPKQLTSLCIFLGGWAAEAMDEGGLDEIGLPNAVQILTVHASKGLEWPVVFLPRISSANFPSSRRRQGPSTFLSANIFAPTEHASGDDGERRLWYVGLTRCKRFLHISSLERTRKKPTVFFTEVHHERIQRDGPIPTWPKGTPSPPSNVGVLPTTYSDLSYFWRCPFEYQLRSLMRFGPGVRESYGYGQQIHNVLAEIHKHTERTGEPMSVDDAVALLDKRFHLRYTRDGTKHQPLSALRDAAKVTLRRYLEVYPNSRELVLESEKEFEFFEADSGALITGSIDLLQRISEDGETRSPVAIVDFKTHRWRDYEAFMGNVESAERQLRLYALAVRSALNFEAKAAKVHFLSPVAPPKELVQAGACEVVPISITQEQQELMRIEVALAVNSIRSSMERQSFALSGCERGACKKCDYRTFCPGYPMWRSRDRKAPTPESLEDTICGEIEKIEEDLDAGSKSE